MNTCGFHAILFTTAKGAYDMALESSPVLTFALHFCFVPDGTGRAHPIVGAGGGGVRALHGAVPQILNRCLWHSDATVHWWATILPNLPAGRSHNVQWQTKG